MDSVIRTYLQPNIRPYTHKHMSTYTHTYIVININLLQKEELTHHIQYVISQLIIPEAI